MGQQPSGGGPRDKEKSLSVVLATDHDAMPGLSGLATAAGQATSSTKLDTLATKLDTLHTDALRLAPIGPGPGSATPSASKIFGVAFTAAQTLNVNLESAAYAGLKTAIDAGKLLTLKATAGCYYNWATSNITIASASTAASNPGTQGVPIFDGERSDERAPSGSTVLNILGGQVAGTLYISIAE